MEVYLPRQRRVRAALRHATVPGARDALDAAGALRVFPYAERPKVRIYQFDRSRGVEGYPERPKDVLRATRSRAT